ncbi:hypothetical protein Y022_10515 [Streptococcus thermophilus TH1477]|nr:hypothetical protein Y022_10515 [Streptococcus thermophilus TH1477]
MVQLKRIKLDHVEHTEYGTGVVSTSNIIKNFIKFGTLFFQIS